MNYRFVTAIAAGTIGLSTGMVRFEPDNEDDRYHGGVFTTADANKIFGRKLGEDKGPAGPEDFAAYMAKMSGNASNPGRRLAEVLRTHREEMEKAGEDVDVPQLDISPAAAGALLTNSMDDTPLARGTEDLGVRQLRATLQQTSDPVVLTQMLDAEQKGQNRQSALKAIEQRIRKVGAQSDASPQEPSDAGPVVDESEGSGEGADGDDEVQSEITVSSPVQDGDGAPPSETAQAPVSPVDAAPTAATGDATPAASEESEGETAGEGETGDGISASDPDAAPSG